MQAKPKNENKQQQPNNDDGDDGNWFLPTASAQTSLKTRLAVKCARNQKSASPFNSDSSSAAGCAVAAKARSVAPAQRQLSEAFCLSASLAEWGGDKNQLKAEISLSLFAAAGCAVGVVGFSLRCFSCFLCCWHCLSRSNALLFGHFFAFCLPLAKANAEIDFVLICLPKELSSFIHIHICYTFLLKSYNITHLVYAMLTHFTAWQLPK